MTPQRKGPALREQRHGPEITGRRSKANSITPALRNAAARALERELAIIVMAAHRMAAGYGLAWPDYDRLHEAHQHVIRVLAALRGGEVLQ